MLFFLLNHPASFGAVLCCALFIVVVSRSQVARLRNQLQLINAVVDHIQVSVIACDQQGNVTCVNSTLKSLHPFPSNVRRIRELADHVHLYTLDGRTRIQTDQTPLLLVLEGKTLQDMEVTIRRGENDDRTAVVSGTKIFSTTEVPLGGVVIKYDITERKRRSLDVRQDS